jgi:hypothetical protein
LAKAKYVPPFLIPKFSLNPIGYLVAIPTHPQKGIMIIKNNNHSKNISPKKRNNSNNNHNHSKNISPQKRNNNNNNNNSKNISPKMFT